MKKQNKVLVFTLSALLFSPGILEAAATEEAGTNIKDEVTVLESVSEQENNIIELTEEALAIEEVRNLIKVDLPLPKDITLEDKDLIERIREKYDALTAEQQAEVKNYALLERAEEELAKLEDTDQQESDIVIAMIDALPTFEDILFDDKETIEAARTAYDGLTDEAKELVTNLSDLERAEEALAAKEVGNMIKVDLPLPKDITLEDKDLIERIRAKYDALTDDAKALVRNYALLERAEEELTDLEEDEDALVVESIEVLANKVVFVNFNRELLEDELNRDDFKVSANGERLDITSFYANPTNIALGFPEIERTDETQIVIVEVEFNGETFKSEPFEIKPEILRIVEVITDFETIEVDLGGSYSLPEEAEVRLSNDETIFVPVRWRDTVDVNTPGTYDVKGNLYVTELDNIATTSRFVDVQVIVAEEVATYPLGIEIRNLDDKRTSEVEITITNEDGDIFVGSYNEYKQWSSDEELPEGQYTITLDTPEGTIAKINDTVALQRAVSTGENNIFTIDVNAENKEGLSAVFAAFRLVEGPTDPEEAKEAAYIVDRMIYRLPNVAALTLEDAELVEAVRAAYEDLSEEAKTHVKNLRNLESRENRIKALDDETGEVVDKFAVRELQRKIYRLPNTRTITLDDAPQVETIRAEYEALNDASKEIFSPQYLKNLEIREQRLEELKIKE